MSNIILISEKIDSKAELIEKLNQGKAKTILFGENAQQSREFTLILAKNQDTDMELLRIGVISEGHGLKAQYAIVESDEIVIGFNKEICLVPADLSNKVIRRGLGSLFYEFKIVRRLNAVLVICEAEIYCLNRKLEITWHVCTDLIVDCEITDEYVKVVTNEETKIYSTFDGRVM